MRKPHCLPDQFHVDYEGYEAELCPGFGCTVSARDHWPSADQAWVYYRDYVRGREMPTPIRRGSAEHNVLIRLLNE